MFELSLLMGKKSVLPASCFAGKAGQVIMSSPAKDGGMAIAKRGLSRRSHIHSHDHDHDHDHHDSENDNDNDNDVKKPNLQARDDLSATIADSSSGASGEIAPPAPATSGSGSANSPFSNTNATTDTINGSPLSNPSSGGGGDDNSNSSPSSSASPNGSSASGSFGSTLSNSTSPPPSTSTSTAGSSSPLSGQTTPGTPAGTDGHSNATSIDSGARVPPNAPVEQHKTSTVATDVGIVFFVAMVILCGMFVWWRRRSQKRQAGGTSALGTSQSRFESQKLGSFDSRRGSSRRPLPEDGGGGGGGGGGFEPQFHPRMPETIYPSIAARSVPAVSMSTSLSNTLEQEDQERRFAGERRAHFDNPRSGVVGGGGDSWGRSMVQTCGSTDYNTATQDTATTKVRVPTLAHHTSLQSIGEALESSPPRKPDPSLVYLSQSPNYKEERRVSRVLGQVGGDQHRPMTAPGIRVASYATFQSLSPTSTFGGGLSPQHDHHALGHGYEQDLATLSPTQKRGSARRKNSDGNRGSIEMRKHGSSLIIREKHSIPTLKRPMSGVAGSGRALGTGGLRHALGLRPKTAFDLDGREHVWDKYAIVIDTDDMVSKAGEDVLRASPTPSPEQGDQRSGDHPLADDAVAVRSDQDLKRATFGCTRAGDEASSGTAVDAPRLDAHPDYLAMPPTPPGATRTSHISVGITTYDSASTSPCGSYSFEIRDVVVKRNAVPDDMPRNVSVDLLRVETPIQRMPSQTQPLRSKASIVRRANQAHGQPQVQGQTAPAAHSSPLVAPAAAARNIDDKIPSGSSTLDQTHTSKSSATFVQDLDWNPRDPHDACIATN
ncbi:hypothetical protein BCV70DRAFT_223089 [Testicularia cyperi]|uniref:Uncharacterized protein n=1 Tax=Testicularia cyperi TaxID=1882483 RepID=A0A317XRM0_9BASI|nr:hypothetical protein BCV70DRAFT_223089 [Testicularia cyperi]